MCFVLFASAHATNQIGIRTPERPGYNNSQTAYGYALMGNDVTATTSAQLLAYTNNYFPPIQPVLTEEWILHQLPEYFILTWYWLYGF